ncbi:MAG TPA: thioredoxin, partial [Microbacterium sp.]|nr:thioredoxin [Microbacterium sp.]
MRGAVDLSSLRNRPDPAEPRAAGGSASSALVRDVTDATFGEVLELSRTVPVVVDLWAEWCGPCKQLTPALEKLVTAADGAVRLAKVNVDALPELAQALQVKSLPTVMAVHKGKLVDSFQGVLPDAQLKQFVEKAVALGGGGGQGP